MIPITKDLLERLIRYTHALAYELDNNPRSPNRAVYPFIALLKDINKATALLSQHNHETDKNEGE